jgi:hypothetical protein
MRLGQLKRISCNRSSLRARRQRWSHPRSCATPCDPCSERRAQRKDDGFGHVHVVFWPRHRRARFYRPARRLSGVGEGDGESRWEDAVGTREKRRRVCWTVASVEGLRKRASHPAGRGRVNRRPYAWHWPLAASDRARFVTSLRGSQYVLRTAYWSQSRIVQALDTSPSRKRDGQPQGHSIMRRGCKPSAQLATTTSRFDVEHDHKQ